MNWQGFSAQSAHRIWRDFIGYGAHRKHCFLFPFINISIWILKQRFFFFLLWIEGSCLLVVKNFQISSQHVFVASRLFLCQSCLSVWVALLFVSCSILSHPLCHSLTHTHSSQPSLLLDSLRSCFLVAFQMSALFSSSAYSPSLVAWVHEWPAPYLVLQSKV